MDQLTSVKTRNPLDGHLTVSRAQVWIRWQATSFQRSLGTVKKIPSRVSWGDLSGDLYIIFPKPPYPAGKIPPGMEFFVQCQGLIFLAARWSGPAASASIFSVCLDYILRVCQSLWDSFLSLGKLHWFLYLLLSYFYDPGMFIFRWSSNFVEKVVFNESMSAKIASRVSYLVYYYCI